jgi:hypothetical protein
VALSNTPVQMENKSHKHSFRLRSKWTSLTVAILIAVPELLLYTIEPKNLSLGWLLFFIVAVLGVFFPIMRDVWTLRERTRMWEKADLWIGTYVLCVVGFAIVVSKTGILVWNSSYFAIPFSLSSTLLSLVATITERKKMVRVYGSIRGPVFETETLPRTWITEFKSWLPYLLVVSIPLYWFHDEALDPGFKGFYIDNCREIPDKENVAAGLAGLDAPVGSNFMDFGVAKFQTNRQELYVRHNVSQAPSQAKIQIDFVGSGDELSCWILNPDSRKSASSTMCASETRLKEILSANSDLLSRYWQMSQLQHFQGLGTNGTLFLNINRLIAADVELKLQHGKFEDAYKEWKSNYQFVNRMNGEDTTWIDKAIIMAADYFSLSSVDSLIHLYPSVATAHGEELISLLSPSGLSRWNLPGALRAVYLMFDPIIASDHPSFWLHRNFIQNRFIYFARDFLKAADASPNLVEEKTEAVWKRYGNPMAWSNDYLRDPMNTIFYRLKMSGSLRSGALIGGMYKRDGDRRALTLALLIKHRGLKDTEIETFLASVGPELKNPFTGTPMGWDSTKRVIRFDVPKDGYRFDVQL